VTQGSGTDALKEVCLLHSSLWSKAKMTHMYTNANQFSIPVLIFCNKKNKFLIHKNQHAKGHMSVKDARSVSFRSELFTAYI